MQVCFLQVQNTEGLHFGMGTHLRSQGEPRFPTAARPQRVVVLGQESGVNHLPGGARNYTNLDWSVGWRSASYPCELLGELMRTRAARSTGNHGRICKRRCAPLQPGQKNRQAPCQGRRIGNVGDGVDTGAAQ